MIYSLIVQSSPMQTSGPISALKFAQALLDSGHTIYRIFLYGDAVYIGSTQQVPPQGEQNISEEWANFITCNKIDAVVCIAAALKRGVLNKEEATRYDKCSPILDNAYDLSGLGQLIDASVNSDKMITF